RDARHRRAAARDTLLRYVREDPLALLGLARALRHPHHLLPHRVRADVSRRDAEDDRGRARVLRAVHARVPRRLLQSRLEAGRRPVHKGNGEVRPAFPVPRGERDLSRAAWATLLLAGARPARPPPPPP